mmetsp:Transcript_9252/g.39228  ORF Transcript_9252/g.39228 Transcript_9252/m.39228 type:complete len:339 (+) Transcript_9252:773-1789(+)
MEVDASDPVFVPVAGHDQVAVRQVPHLPRSVVRRRGQDGFLGVQRDVRHGHQVALERLAQLEVLHGDGLGGFLVLGRARVASGVRRRGGRRAARRRARRGRTRLRDAPPRRTLGGRRRLSLGPCGFHRRLRRLFPRLLRRGCLFRGSLPGLLLLRLLLGLLRLLHLDRLELREKPVALDAHQHLLFHGELVLALELLDRGLVLRVVLAQLLDVPEQLVFLLADALVVHAVHVALLAELLPRRRRLLHNSLLRIHLAPQSHALVVQLLVVVVHVGHSAHVLFVQLAGGLHLVPLRLELLESPGQAHANHEVAHEVIHHLRPLGDLPGVGFGFHRGVRPH